MAESGSSTSGESMSPRLSRLFAEPAPLPWLKGRPWTPWFIVGLVSIGAFVGQLDATIVQLALPSLGHAFGVTLDQVSWVALCYLLAFAALLPIFGQLCDMIGRKSLYIAGYGLFIAASALCAMAASFEQLLAFRTLQGAGGALLGANSIAILVKTVAPADRGRALGYFAAAQAIGMSAGPALGGLILVTLGWRWIFWITVPFGALAMLAGWLALPRTAAIARGKRFDWGGALLIGPALILLVATLNHLAGWGLASPATLGCLAAAGAMLWLLARRERRSASPLIDPRLFAGLAFRCGAAAVALAYALLYGIFFLMSFAQEHGYGESPAEAGLRLVLIPVALGLAASFSHGVKNRLGEQRIGLLGMGLCLCGIVILFLAAGVPSRHHLLDPMAYVLFGVGLGLFIAPNNHTSIAAAPAELSGSAGALLNLMRVLGTSLGVAAAATMLAWRLQAEGVTGQQWMTADGSSLLSAFRGSLPILALLALGAAWAGHIAASGRTTGQLRAAAD
jgi:EmrB/QacA subfamily drug resistance transporter